MKVLFLVSSPGHGHRRCADAVAAALAGNGQPLDGQPLQTEYLDIHDIIDKRVSDAIIDGYLRMTADHPALYQRLYDLDRTLYRQLAGEMPPDREIADFLAGQQRRWFPEEAEKSWLTAGYKNLDIALINTLVNGVRAGRGNPANRLLMRGLLQLIYRILAKRLREAVQQLGADVLIATQMYPAALLRRAVDSGAIKKPIIGIITDYGVHGVWVRSGAQHFCVAHESIARRLRTRGVSADTVTVTGIPLMPGFLNPVSQPEARRQLGLDEQPTLLVTGGQLGIGTLEAVEQILKDRPGEVQVLVTGRTGEGRQDRLRALEADHPSLLKVFTWTDDMATLMRAADLVAGKPGGLTVSESLACGRPFLATCCLGGQEEHNLQFLEQYRLGYRVPATGLSVEVRHLFQAPEQLSRWQRHVAGHGPRDGAARVAALAIRLGGDGTTGHRALVQ